MNNFKKQNPNRILYEAKTQELALIGQMGLSVPQKSWEEFYRSQKAYLCSLNEKVFPNANKELERSSMGFFEYNYVRLFGEEENE